MDEIRRLRDRIDEIDQQIVFLLKARNENAKLLGRIKCVRGIPLRDSEREKIILQRISSLSRRLDLQTTNIEEIFHQIFKMSVKAQAEPGPNKASKLKGLSILIVGGTGRMGRLLAGFAAINGARVKIAGRSLKKAKRISDEIGVVPGTILDAAESDIVILSVPIEETERLAAETAPLMKPGSLLSDVSSVKTGVSDRIASRTSKRIEYVSIHPLFAPNIDQISGQNMAYVSYRSGIRWKRLDQAFRSSGVIMYKMTAGQHDMKMAYIQGLHHFALMSIGLGLGDKGGEPRTSSVRDTETRIARMMENWQTVRSIQRSNPFASKVRRDLLCQVQRIVEMRPGDLSRIEKRLVPYVQKWSRKQ